MRQSGRSVIGVARGYAVSRQTLYASDREVSNPRIDIPEPVMTPPKRDKPKPTASLRDVAADQRLMSACDRGGYILIRLLRLGCDTKMNLASHSRHFCLSCQS